MYSTLPSFVLGFHGCDKAVCEKIISGLDTLRNSTNEYDWLGHGMYFWENDPNRALEYAELLKKHPERTTTPITTPYVLGAVIDLGRCLNLIEYKALDVLRGAYDMFAAAQKKAGLPLPAQKPLSEERDVLKRPLDCAVIESLHQYLYDNKKAEYHSVRGVFWEGGDLYTNAGFKTKNHIQICVRNPNCIKGYFLPQRENTSFPIP